MWGVEASQLVTDLQRLTDGLGELPEPVVRPAFVVVSGLPGTGKSYFCAKLSRRLPFVILESDALRKQLFPTPSYSQPESARLFKTLHLLIEELLGKGIPLILDATNLSERDRERLYNIAERLDARLVLVRVEAPPELVYQRLQSRGNGGDKDNHSDADWAVYRKMRPSVEKINRKHYAVDSSRDIGPVLDKVVRELNR
jgi:predicted kinase